jgi:hypothetical protein
VRTRLVHRAGTTGHPPGRHTTRPFRHPEITGVNPAFAVIPGNHSCHRFPRKPDHPRKWDQRDWCAARDHARAHGGASPCWSTTVGSVDCTTASAVALGWFLAGRIRWGIPNASCIGMHSAIIRAASPTPGPAAGLTPSCFVIMGQSGQIAPEATHDHGSRHNRRRSSLPVGPGLQLVELGVQAASPDQRGVIPAGRYPALVQDDDQVGHPDRGEPVRHEQRDCA